MSFVKFTGTLVAYRDVFRQIYWYTRSTSWCLPSNQILNPQILLIYTRIFNVIVFFFCFFCFFFFSRRYNPWWVLAYFTISFHNLLSLHFSLQFLTFIFFKSSSTWSTHLNLCLPTALDEHGSHSVHFLTVLVVSILITCAAQRNLCEFHCFTLHFVSQMSHSHQLMHLF